MARESTKRSKPDPVADLAARGYIPSRTCETCVWMRRTPEAQGYFDTLLDLYRRGDRRATYPAIVALLHKRFDYPYTEAGIGKHIRRCCRG